MTIKECIDNVDNIKPNQYGTEIKVQWLSFIDEIIINDVLKSHEGYDGRYDDFMGYSADKLSTPLIVPSPYDRLYPAYLKMRIDGENGETARYNNSAALFNTYMMEYRKYYNKTHLPLSTPHKIPNPTNPNKLSVTEAQLEYLKRELYHVLSDDVGKALSDDKLYSIVTSYISNNIQMFKGKSVDAPKIGIVTLLASAWVGKDNLYSQRVNIAGVTKNSQVDLTPDVQQLAIFYNKDLSFVTENDGGVVTVYAIGQKPTNDYTIQVTITEVEI